MISEPIKPDSFQPADSGDEPGFANEGPAGNPEDTSEHKLAH